MWVRKQDIQDVFQDVQEFRLFSYPAYPVIFASCLSCLSGYTSFLGQKWFGVKSGYTFIKGDGNAKT
jgi:hypothetical protein